MIKIVALFIIKVSEDLLRAYFVWITIIRSYFSKLEAVMVVDTSGQSDCKTIFCRRQPVFANTNLSAFFVSFSLL